MMAFFVCQADCFRDFNVNGHLHYQGSPESNAYIEKSDAFSQLQQWCDEDFLLKRSLKSVRWIETPVENEVTHESSESSGYPYYVTTGHARQKFYTVVNSELHATYKIEEANETNSCRPAREDEIPQFTDDGDGNLILP